MLFYHIIYPILIKTIVSDLLLLLKHLTTSHSATHQSNLFPSVNEMDFEVIE